MAKIGQEDLFGHLLNFSSITNEECENHMMISHEDPDGPLWNGETETSDNSEATKDETMTILEIENLLLEKKVDFLPKITRFNNPVWSSFHLLRSLVTGKTLPYVQCTHCGKLYFHQGNLPGTSNIYRTVVSVGLAEMILAI